MVMHPEDALMKSQNFEFLRRKHAELADLGGFAEQYARPDPAGSLMKLRSFIENAVAIIYESYRLQRPYSDNIFDLLNEEQFRGAVPNVVLGKLHSIRKAGNQAAHHQAPTTQVALQGPTRRVRHRTVGLSAHRRRAANGLPDVQRTCRRCHP